MPNNPQEERKKTDYIGNILESFGLNNKKIFEEDIELKTADVRRQLASQKQSDVLSAMKRVVAMMCKGKDVSNLFPDVVKNVISKNFEIRTLVYMYIVFYSVSQPQHALLAINALQKALNEPDYLVRLSALKTMTSIAVRDISQVSLLAIMKSVKDLSPFVRRTAAFALPKLFDLDSSLEEEVLSLLESLLLDESEIVLGAAFSTFSELCPNQWELIHPCFRTACRLLGDMDEWSQITVMRVLARYGREYFLDPRRVNEDHEEPELEADHRFLLNAVLPLLTCINTAVSYHAGLVLYYCGGNNELPLVAKTMMRLLHTNVQTQFYVLDTIATMVIDHPQLFREHISEFYIRTFDTKRVRITKLDILTRIASELNITQLLREMKEYTKDPDVEFVAKAIQSIGKCAMLVPEVAHICQQFLLAQMASDSQEIVAESVVVLKQLLQLEVTQQNGKKQQIADVRLQLEEKEKEKEKELEIEKEKEKEKDETSTETETTKTKEENVVIEKEIDIDEEQEEKETNADTIDEKTEEKQSVEQNIKEKKERQVIRRGVSIVDPLEKELKVLESEYEESLKRVASVVRRLSKLILEITNPLARASILFVIGEYAPKNGTIAPETLRIIAQSFSTEDEIVKLEALNLASKLQLSSEAKSGPHSEVIDKLCSFVFSLAKYDLSFDIRDRTRLLRSFVFPSSESNFSEAYERCRDVLYLAKPVPQVLVVNVANNYTHGTLSHLIAEPVVNYIPMSQFHEEVPPASIRDPIVKIFEQPVDKAQVDEVDDSVLFGEKDENEDDGWDEHEEWGEEANDDDAFGSTNVSSNPEENEDDWGGYEVK